MSDSELITRILSGDEALFSRIVTRYSGYVWAICSSYIRNPADREDVAQETFVECYRSLNTLRSPEAFGRWLSQLARRKCLMWLRASSRREAHTARYEDYMQDTFSAGEAGDKRELHQGIREAIDRLPGRYREALLLRYAEGYSSGEAAAFLGISQAAMRKRIERAQHMLKDELWHEVQPALAHDKHGEKLVRGVLAAIPFGNAPWLGGSGSAAVAAASVATTAGSKLALVGGFFVMSKQALFVGGAALLLCGLGFLLLKGDAPLSVARPAESTAQNTSETPTPVLPAMEGATVPLAAPELDKTPDTSAAVPAIPRTQAPSASVSGHVRDKAGQPIADADVYVEVCSDRFANEVLKRFQVKSKQDGSYRVDNIDSFGVANLFGTAAGYVMVRVHDRIVPGAKLTRVDFTLPEARFYISGRVVNESQMPVPGASVDTLYFGYNEKGLAHTAATGETTGSISGSKFVFATTDDSGLFSLAIPAEGLCDLRVTKDGFGPGFFPRIATGTDDALLILRAGGAISGKVTGATGGPVAGVQVHVLGEALPGGLEPSTLRIQKLPVPRLSVTTDGGGNYLAEGLGESYTYTVTVPGESMKGDTADDAQDPVRVHIANSMRNLDEDMFGGPMARATRTGIRVKAGTTTANVDLTLGGAAGAVIRGTVTDRSSGKPACPVVVTAALVSDTGEADTNPIWFQTPAGGSAVTHLDGTYELSIRAVGEGQQFRMSYAFMTEGGSAWEQPEEEVALFDLKPGDEKRLDFTVDAPVTVPVRYVDTNGNPLAGISAAMHQAGSRGGCGGTLTSDAEGRVTFHGIPPETDLQAVAWRHTGDGTQTLGESEPFSGQAGETIAEVVVVCRMPGGIEGTIVYPDGRPVANTPVSCEALSGVGGLPPVQGTVTTDGQGALRILDAVPEGVYRVARVAFVDPDSARPYVAQVQNVEVIAGSVTSLGTLAVQPEKDLSRVVDAADWGRNGNEAIAATYSKEAVEEMSSPPRILKTGFALYDVGRYQEALDTFVRMSSVSSDNATMSAVSYIWQGHMLDLLGRRQEAIAAYGAAAVIEGASDMRHDQFGMDYVPSEYARERMQQPFTRIENTMK